MNTLAIEAEVDSQGWLNIHAPAPPGTAPGKLDVVVVWSPLTPTSGPVPVPCLARSNWPPISTRHWRTFAPTRNESAA